MGEPTKNGKEIFGFASPLQTTKKALLYLSLLVALFSVLAARRGASSRCSVVVLTSVVSTAGSGNSISGLC